MKSLKCNSVHVIFMVGNSTIYPPPPTIFMLSCYTGVKDECYRERAS